MMSLSDILVTHIISIPIYQLSYLSEFFLGKNIATFAVNTTQRVS